MHKNAGNIFFSSFSLQPKALFINLLNLKLFIYYLVSTPIDWLSKIIKRGHYHWFAGNDLTYFRYPDEELLLTGTNLSNRELEVIKCIHKGMISKEISDKLFLSQHTINTHRRSILKKAGKSGIGEVIYDLEGIGMI